MFILNCVHHFVKCYASKSSEQSACFDWLTVNNTCLPVRNEFTNTKKLVKKLTRVEASSICRQQFANVFAYCIWAVHTHQLEFANYEFATFNLPCKGRLTPAGDVKSKQQSITSQHCVIRDGLFCLCHSELFLLMSV